MSPKEISPNIFPIINILKNTFKLNTGDAAQL